jgi:signal transduction histidine kinase
MNPEPAPPVPLELPSPRGATWPYPWWGLLLGVAIGILVGHPLAMLAFTIHDSIQSGTPLDIGGSIIHSFSFHMWPMMLLFALFGGITWAFLGFIIHRLRENRLRLDTLHREFEAQVATLRHHYKNLALGISGFSQRIQRKTADLDQCLKECAQRDCPVCTPLREDLAALQGNVAVLDDAARRLTDTLGHELLFLRALAGEALVQEERDLYPLLLAAIQDLLSLRFRDKDLEVDINGRPWPECRDSLTFAFEPYAMEVMMQNLLSNAMKYGDRIHIAVADKGNRVHLTVQDDGPGIEVAQLQRQLATPGDRRQDSTQLGLRVCLHLLEKVGGRLWVASIPGAGATFTLEVPKQAAGPQGQPGLKA